MARYGVHVQVLLDEELFLSSEIRPGHTLTIGPHPGCAIPTTVLKKAITLLEPCRNGFGLHLAPPLSGEVLVGGRRIRVVNGLLMDPRPEPLVFSNDDCGVIRLNEHIKLRFTIHCYHYRFRSRFPIERRLALSLAASAAIAAATIMTVSHFPSPIPTTQLSRLQTRPARLLMISPRHQPEVQQERPKTFSQPALTHAVSNRSRQKTLGESKILRLHQQPPNTQLVRHDMLEQAMAALEATITPPVPALGVKSRVGQDPVIESITKNLTSVALPGLSSLRLTPMRPKDRPRLAARQVTNLSSEEIRQVVARSSAPIQHCYERELISSIATKEGRIVFRWLIDSAGKATQITVAKNTLGLPALQQCILREIHSWVFPPCPQGCVVVYPFEFFTRV